MPYYGVSHWSVARDGGGEIGPRMLALYIYRDPQLQVTEN